MPTPPVTTADHRQSWYDPGSNSWDRADGPTLVGDNITVWYQNNRMSRLIMESSLDSPDKPHFWEDEHARTA